MRNFGIACITPGYFELYTCKSSSPGEALLCFGVTHVHWVQHWYYCNAGPSFSEHTYDIPLCEALWVIFGIFWVRSTLCCALKRCMYSIGQLPPFWDITKSPIGWSTALTPTGWSFEIGRSKSRCTTPPYIAPLTVAESTGEDVSYESYN